MRGPYNGNDYHHVSLITITAPYYIVKRDLLPFSGSFRLENTHNSRLTMYYLYWLINIQQAPGAFFNNH